MIKISLRLNLRELESIESMMSGIFDKFNGKEETKISIQDFIQEILSPDEFQALEDLMLKIQNNLQYLEIS